MKVLVTGATGFTGFNLCKALAADGDQVLAIARASSNCQQLETAEIPYQRIDLFDRAELQAAMAQIDVVYQFAAAYRTEHADAAEFWRVNVEATEVLLECAQAAGVKRFVHC